VASDIASFGKFGTTDKIRKADTLRKANLRRSKEIWDRRCFNQRGIRCSGSFARR